MSRGAIQSQQGNPKRVAMLFGGQVRLEVFIREHALDTSLHSRAHRLHGISEGSPVSLHLRSRCPLPLAYRHNRTEQGQGISIVQGGAPPRLGTAGQPDLECLSLLSITNSSAGLKKIDR